MQALPVDVFQEILDHLFRPITSRTQWPIANSELRSLCPLQETCRLWRETILAMPSMWSCIQVSGKFDERHVEYVRTRLERSRDAPLDIYLREPRALAVDQQNHLRDCFGLVSSHLARIRRLYMWTSTFEIDDLEVFTQPLPLLEELGLVPRRGYHDDLVYGRWQHGDPRYFQRAPHLCRLDLHTACMVPAQELSKLSYLSLSLRGAPIYNYVWQTLELTPALRELKLYFPDRGWYDGDHGDVRDLSLPRLERLSTFGYVESFVFVERLSAPRLTTLAVSVEPCNRASRLFRTLRDRVRHLIITTVETRHGGLLDEADTVALDELESLSTLELRDIRENMLSTGNQSFFQHLIDHVTQSTDGHHWSARVRTLILRRCRFNWKACGTLMRFLEVRQSATAVHGQPMLSLELIDTTFVKYGTYKPAGFDAIAHYFSNAQFERVYLNSTQWQEPVDEWDEWSDADDDGGVIGWQIFNGTESSRSIDDA